MSILINELNYVYSSGTAYEIHALKDVNLKIEDGEFIVSSDIPVPVNPP